MSTYWIIGSDGRTYGPADLATAQRWVAEGRIVASTQVARSPDGPWNDATLAPELAQAFGAEPAAESAPAATPAAPTAPPTQPVQPVTPAGWPPNAIGISQFVSGIFNLIAGVGWLFTCFGVVLTVPLVILGVTELLASSRARTANPLRYLESARTMAILDICTVLAGNLGSVVCGIVILTQLGEAGRQLTAGRR